MTTKHTDTSQDKALPEPRIAKVKGSAVCPKGHRAPRVQYLANEEVYCCTTCAITWKAIFEVTIPAGISGEKWAQMAAAAGYMLTAHEQIIALASGWDENGAIGPKSPLSWESVARMAMDIAQAAKAKAEGRYKEHVAAIAKLDSL